MRRWRATPRMMYLSPSEFAARFDDLGDFPAEVVSAALDDANGLVTGYVSVLYPSLVSVPVLLRSATSDIARRKLYKFDPPVGVQNACDAALKVLRDIASGIIQMPASYLPVSPDGDTLIFSGSEVRRLNIASWYSAGAGDDE